MINLIVHVIMSIILQNDQLYFYDLKFYSTKNEVTIVNSEDILFVDSKQGRLKLSDSKVRELSKYKYSDGKVLLIKKNKIVDIVSFFEITSSHYPPRKHFLINNGELFLENNNTLVFTGFVLE